MKNLVKKIKAQELIKNNRGQGMLEYILLVVVVVGLIVLARPFFKDKMEQIQGELSNSIGNVLGGG